MCLIYLISFCFSVLGIFGVGHLFAGSPRKGVSYFIAGLIWTTLAAILGISSGGSLLFCFIPLHVIFAHFCAADAVRVGRGEK